MLVSFTKIPPSSVCLEDLIDQRGISVCHPDFNLAQTPRSMDTRCAVNVDKTGKAKTSLWPKLKRHKQTPLSYSWESVSRANDRCLTGLEKDGNNKPNRMLQQAFVSDNTAIFLLFLKVI
ncbi:hypothetical protein LEMLEM_LOCUS13771, partial [Lemmus lemmus]